MRTLPRGYWLACVGALLVGMGLRVVVDAATGDPRGRGAAAGGGAAVLDALRPERPAPRSTSVYGGLGVWVDAFDFSPSYTSRDPVVTAATVDEWAELGVDTVYLQASRPDDRAPGVLLEEDLLGELLVRAHAEGISVVGWYLPTFVDVDADLERLLAIASFEALGHRFDGVAVDIEFIEGVPDDDERSRRLVSLSTALRAALPGEALGGIVPPAVQLEVVNPGYWPRFPWRELDAVYDVWMPMAYWTTRTAESGYRDPYAYTEESTRRMRNNLGRPDAVVHPVGGIGDATLIEDLGAYRRALVDVGAIGGSLYDWASLPPAQRAVLPEVVPSS